MNQNQPDNPAVLDIRKYPNRRYYDATHSKHVTLDDIGRLIREGHDIRVTDSKSGDDITGRVLTQILMDQDPLKLGVFPDDLLHTLIRSNEQLVLDFVEKYFNQALEAFLGSQKQFDAYLRQAVGLGGQAPAANPFAAGFISPFMPPFVPTQPAPAANGPAKEPQPEPEAAPERSSEAAELRQMVEELRKQVAQLSRQAEAE